MKKSKLKDNYVSLLNTLNTHSDYKWKTCGYGIEMLDVPNGYSIDLDSTWRTNSNVHVRLYGENGWAMMLKTVKFDNCICLDLIFREVVEELYNVAVTSPPIVKRPSDIDRTIEFLSMFDKHDRPKGYISKEMIKEVVEHDTLTHWSGSDEDEPVVTVQHTKEGEGQ